MNTVIQRQRSRRRLAALTFLSNISLDGTHKDTKLLQYAKTSVISRTSTGSETKEKENQLYSRQIKAPQNINELDVFSDKQESEKNIVDASERLFLRKRGTAYVGLSEKPYHLSSSESLGGNLAGRFRTLSSSISECSGPTSKEVKVVKIESNLQFKGERLIILSERKYPVHVFSSISYNRPRFGSVRGDHSRGDARRRQTSGTRPLSTISDSIDPLYILSHEDIGEVSYCNLLVPSRTFKRTQGDQVDGGVEVVESLQGKHPAIARCFSYEPATHKATSHYASHSQHASCYERDEIMRIPAATSLTYYPNMLDDPELRAGKHRKLLRFPSYMTSVIDYTKPSELKKELNDKFKGKFPFINLTLSKLRSLKREMLKIAKLECDIDLLTVAQAYVYFEQMILKIVVNKQNRKLIAGACLILSAKMNDVKGEALSNLLEKSESVFRLNRRELLDWEFRCLISLEFGLHVPMWQVNTHYQRLLFES